MSKRQRIALITLGGIILTYILVVAIVRCERNAEAKQEAVAQIETPPVVPMWIFNPNSTLGEIRESLTKERVIDAEEVLTSDSKDIVQFSSNRYVVEYLGVDWNNYTVSVSDGIIHYVWFGRFGNSRHTFYETSVKALIKKLDEIYGKHRQTDIKDREARIWDWVKEDVNVVLFVAKAKKSNDFVMLGFEKETNGIMEKILEYAEITAHK